MEPREALDLAAKKPGAMKDSPGYGKGLRIVPIKVSTRTDEIDGETGKKKELRGDFNVAMPADLETAVEVFGEKVVHRYFINALVVDLQASERTKLTPPSGEGRKKASYLEELGL